MIFEVVSCRAANPSGPISLYQDRSIRFRAVFCPFLRRFVELRRWVRRLKYPSVVEKFDRGFCLGRIRAWVSFDISRARTMPRAVMMMAVILMDSGMVVGGVFVGRMKEVIMNPAVMLPSARRVIGERIAGLFSFIGVRTGMRVYPVCTIRVIRVVYTAVKDVARRVRRRAQVFRYDVFRFSIIASFE